MNDRFKFRGYWYNDYLKEWRIYDNPQFITGDGTAQIWYDTEGGAYPELPFDAKLHLCQCTGLKDKNGKLIYEGDIVRFKDCNDILVINYQKEMACFAPQFYCNGKYGGRLYFDDYDSFECQFYKSNNFEVIGNIYQNKELLEDTECQK